MFTIRVHATSKLIEVRLGDLMTVEEVAAYIAELKRLHAAHRFDHYAMVIDATACPVQSQEMTRTMAQQMATMPPARALAVVVDSPLARMQVRRLFTQPYARIVATPQAGRAWVLSGTEPDAA